MGGGKNWWNPLSIIGGGGGGGGSTVITVAPEPAPVAPAPVEAPAQKTTAKKRKPNTVLTNMQGDLGNANTLHQTLGGT